MSPGAEFLGKLRCNIGAQGYGAAPPPNPRDDFGRWPAVSAHRVVDRSAVETETGGAIAAGQRGAHEPRGAGRQPGNVALGSG